MSRMIDLIRRVVQQELLHQRTSLLGVVTTVFPHTAADDENNYEVNLRLKHEDLELRKVPLAVSHMGIAAPPRVGDLVLVQFINGDLNQAVITGRFYHAGDRPPLHQEDDILFEQRVSDDTLNHLRFTPNGTIYLQRDVTKPEDNSEASATIRIDGESKDIEITSGEKIVIQITHGDTIQIKTGDNVAITLTKDDSIEIKATSKPIQVSCDTMTVDGNVMINGDLKVSTASGSTTIRGNEITGA